MRAEKCLQRHGQIRTVRREEGGGPWLRTGATTSIKVRTLRQASKLARMEQAYSQKPNTMSLGRHNMEEIMAALPIIKSQIT